MTPNAKRAETGGGSPKPRISGRLWGVLLVILTGCVEAGVELPPGWSAGGDGGGSGNWTGSESCEDGATRSCQVEVDRLEDWVYCLRGQQTCREGLWGACEDGTVTREVLAAPKVAEATTNLRRSLSYSTAATCSGVYANACDPRCQWYNESSSSTSIAASAGGGSGTSIDGDFCEFSLYSPNDLYIVGGSVTGKVASCANTYIGNSGAVSLTGDVSTYGNLSVTNGSTIYGTAEVRGYASFSNFNGNKAIIGTGTKYTSQSATEANRVALWLGASSATCSDIWQWSWSGTSPAGYVQGSTRAALHPCVPGTSTTYGTWSTNGTTYKNTVTAGATVISGFDGTIFTKSKCSTATAKAIPTKTISSCSGSNTSFTVNSGTSATYGPGNYGWITLNGGTLHLSGPGTYNIYGFTLNASSTLNLKGITTGTYNINICDSWTPSSNFNVTFSDTSYTAETVDYTKILWYYAGTSGVTINSGTTGFAGVITVPNASITIHPGKTINGLVHAKDIYMDQGSVAPVAGPSACSTTPPPSAATTVLFDQVYLGTCPVGTLPHWTYLIWDNTIPAGTGATITFSAFKGQTSAAVAAAATTSFTALAPTATETVPDCPLTGGPASCPVDLSPSDKESFGAIRLRAVANYTTPLATSIAVNSWKLFYTCKDAL